MSVKRWMFLALVACGGRAGPAHPPRHSPHRSGAHRRRSSRKAHRHVVLPGGSDPWLNDRGLRVPRPPGQVRRHRRARGGVSFDAPADNLAWAQKKGFSFELWSDTDRTLARYYGAAADVGAKHASRGTVLLDARGNLLLEYEVGLNIGAHPSDVLADCERIWRAAPGATAP